jgi:hypothetical protein
MNLSQWQNYSRDDRLRLLSAVGSAVRNRANAPQRYLLLHPEARLDDEERRQILPLDSQRATTANGGRDAVTCMSLAPYRNWSLQGESDRRIPPAEPRAVFQ